MHVLITVLVVAAGLALAVWAGSRLLGGDAAGSTTGNAFGGFDVFNPGRERAEHDLESQKHQTVVTPAAEDDDRAVRVDTDANQVRIRRPAPKDPGL